MMIHLSLFSEEHPPVVDDSPVSDTVMTKKTHTHPSPHRFIHAQLDMSHFIVSASCSYHSSNQPPLDSLLSLSLSLSLSCHVCHQTPSVSAYRYPSIHAIFLLLSPSPNHQTAPPLQTGVPFSLSTVQKNNNSCMAGWRFLFSFSMQGRIDHVCMYSSAYTYLGV